MDEMGIAQPKGGTATSESEALELAHDLRVPRPRARPYVLGGRAMRVVEDDAELEEYIEEAVRVSPDKPILVDQFLDDAVELDVDAVADGDDVLLGGVMEHVESAGVHSGDSACMIPPRARWARRRWLGSARSPRTSPARSTPSACSTSSSR